MVTMPKQKRVEAIDQLKADDEDIAPVIKPEARGRKQQATPTKRVPLQLQLSQTVFLTQVASTTQPARSQPANSKRSSSAGEELWVERHAPKSEAELVVHRKKLAELRGWLQLQQQQQLGNRLLLVTGPTGCGKTAAVRVLSAALGFGVTEWLPPAPTLWNEHLWQGGDTQYVSKLNAFEHFVVRAKLATLPLQPSSLAVSSATLSQQARQQRLQHNSSQGSQDTGPHHRKLLLVEDLPYAAQTVQRQRLTQMLGELAGTARCPVVLTITESTSQSGSEKGYRGSAHGLQKELVDGLMRDGAAVVSFNPLTSLNITRKLTSIAEAEGFDLPASQLSSIAERSAGDLYNAIETLQVACLGMRRMPRGGAKKATRKRKAPAGKAAAGEKAEHVIGLFLGRDAGLGHFHALGKILYNKRSSPADGVVAAEQGSSGSQTSTCLPAAPDPTKAHTSQCALAQVSSCCQTIPPVAARHRRLPMTYVPEEVQSQSGADTATMAAFLHENMLHFIDDTGIEDARDAARYLSDAGSLLDHAPSWQESWEDDASSAPSLSEAIAGSVVLRGLLYANAHPAPRRWLPLTGPVSFAVQRAISSNTAQLSAVINNCALASPVSASAGPRTLAAELLPYARGMPGSPAAAGLLPAQWSRVWQGQVMETCTAAASVVDATGWQPGEDAAEMLLESVGEDGAEEIENC